jgi:hypothetical protein
VLATHLGFYNTATSRTHVRFQFSTHAAAGGNVAPNSAFENADLRIYRANDGAAFSATQRSSSNGITMTSPFDSLTGFHDVDIDLTDNTDSGFYTAGYLYAVVLAPDETVDSQTLTGVVLAYFEIGVQPVNVTQYGGTAGSFTSGRPSVDVNSLAANSITAAATAADFSTEVNAAVLAVLGALNDAAADGAVTTTDTMVAYLKQLINTLEGTPGIPAYPAAAVPGNAVSIAEVIRQIYDEVAGLNGGALLDAAGIRTAVGLASANLDTQLSTIDTVVDAVKVTTDKLDDTLEDQGGGVFGFTEASLQEAPSAGGGTDWNADERTAIRAILGIPASGTTPETPTTGILDTLNDKLGSPAGASLSADVAAVKTQTAAIEVDTQDIQGRLPAALVSGRMDASVGAMAANVMTAAAAAADLTTELQSGLATAAALNTLDGKVDDIKDQTDQLVFDAGGGVNANITHVISDPVQTNGSTATNWGGAP